MSKAACRRVFLFASQGGQWPGMGAQLYAEEPDFREVIDACSRIISERLGWSLAQLLPQATSDLLARDPYHLQPALTAVQLATSAWLRSRGVTPDAVAGLSMGEVAAASEAGILTLKEALHVVCVQARLTRQPQPDGRMIFAQVTPEAIRRRLAASKWRAWLSVELSPSMVVVSGASGDVERLLGELRRDGVRCDFLPMAFAFHSPMVDGLEADFRDRVGPLQPRAARLPIFSAVLAARARRPFGTDHWWAIMREPASLPRMVSGLLKRGARQIVEIGPEPILETALREIIAGAGSAAIPVATMRRGAAGAADLAVVAASLARR